MPCRGVALAARAVRRVGGVEFARNTWCARPRAKFRSCKRRRVVQERVSFALLVFKYQVFSLSFLTAVYFRRRLRVLLDPSHFADFRGDNTANGSRQAFRLDPHVFQVCCPRQRLLLWKSDEIPCLFLDILAPSTPALSLPLSLYRSLCGSPQYLS